jgi:hypothetical protein
LASAISKPSFWLKRPDGSFLGVEDMEYPVHADQLEQRPDRWRQAA